MTRHFDKLRACAIGWEMRKYAKISTIVGTGEVDKSSRYFRKKKPRKLID